jgi:o-succinylbenzoate synthase
MTTALARRPGITLEEVELRRIRLPLVAPFRTSFGTQTEREALLVRATTSEGQGWGECVAMTEPLYSSEYLAAADDVIRHHLLPRLFRAGPVTAEGVGPALEEIVGHRMAKGALEMAVLDAELRASGVSFGDYLGATHAEIDCGVSVGIQDTVPRLLETVAAYLAEGYRRVKLKIEPGWDVEPVRAVRETFGPTLPLQVDANSAYSLSDSDRLRELDRFGLLLLEQPFPEEEILAHATLARLIETPVCLDESITCAQVARDAIELGACEVVNIKPGRVGGYVEARRIHDLCLERRIPVWCGGMLETGIGRAANIALAALPGFVLTGDVSASSRFYRQDITPPFVMIDGRLKVPAGPGLGVDVLPAVLDAVTVSTGVVRPPA